MYKIIALVGKAGSGKDTLLNELFKINNDFNKIISTTTRPIREGEQEGVDYYYISQEEFAQKVFNDEMLEACIFNDWGYGTSLSSLSEDKVNIGVFNPSGIYSMCDRKDIKLKIFYIYANDKERVLRQLNREENPNVNEIIRRYSTDERDFLEFENDGFSMTILNNNCKEHLTQNIATILLEAQNMDKTVQNACSENNI